MQFTPQQLAGGAKFSSVTRIGNWQEEIALEEAKQDNFKKRSTAGNLSLRKLEQKFSVCTEIVPHSFSGDGIIRFGDSIILKHESSSSILVCDPFETVPITDETYSISASNESPIPKARNVFRIVRPPRHLQDVTDRDDDPVLKVGQPFLLACSESLLIQPNSNLLKPVLYISSTKKNERTSTKRTNRQTVFLKPGIDADGIWMITIPSKGKANGTERFLAIGTPATIDQVFQFTHRQTNMYLTVDAKITTTTEFGVEYECYADRSTAYGKIGLMVSEYKGLSTSQTLSKPDAATFSWSVVYASDPSNAMETRRFLPPPPTKDTILHEIQEFIRNRGVDAYWNLHDYLLSLLRGVPNPNGKIDRVDLKLSLAEWGIKLNPKYLDVVLDTIDNGRMGLIDLQSFFALIRGEMPSSRFSVLQEIFMKLDQEHQGYIVNGTLTKNFNGSEHPLVSIGGYSPSYALEHMIKYFDTLPAATSYAHPTHGRLIQGSTPTPVSATNNAKRITFDAFLQYYGDLSAAIDQDDYFITVVRNNWPL